MKKPSKNDDQSNDDLSDRDYDDLSSGDYNDLIKIFSEDGKRCVLNILKLVKLLYNLNLFL